MAGGLRRGQGHGNRGALRLLGIGLAQQALGLVVPPVGEGGQGALEPAENSPKRCGEQPAARSSSMYSHTPTACDAASAASPSWPGEDLLLLPGPAVELADALLQQSERSGGRRRPWPGPCRASRGRCREPAPAGRAWSISGLQVAEQHVEGALQPAQVGGRGVQVVA